MDDVQTRLGRARAALRSAPRPAPPPLELARMAGLLALTLYTIYKLWRWFHLPSSVLVLLGLAATWLTTGKKLVLTLRLPLERTPVVVVDKRVVTDGAIRLHYLVIQDEQGRRREHSMSERVAQTIAVGDVGVLFTKQDVVWGFYAV